MVGHKAARDGPWRPPSLYIPVGCFVAIADLGASCLAERAVYVD